MMSKFQSVLFISLIIFSFHKIHSQNIFVSNSGNDLNDGSIAFPLASISTAINRINLGDTIFVRDGVHSLNSTINISKDGTVENKLFLFAYQQEKPILDYSSMSFSSSNRGVNLKGDYWHIKGITIRFAGDNGINISGSNNIIEFCSFYENKDTGLQLSGGASNNSILNCDSYFNADPDDYEDADGFAPKLDVGSGNYFFGCRAWQNADDGWDGYLRDSNNVSTTLENCWSFSNGYLKDGSTAINSDGNGYKMGGSDDHTRSHNFILKNCLSFYNKAKGFDQNNNRGSITLYNCSAYDNRTNNYSLSTSTDTGKTITLINCLALGNVGSLGSNVIQLTNSWLSPFYVTVDDFKSIDTNGVRNQRSINGVLTSIDFLHLADGSDLIDSGTDVGISFDGSAPDLGAFETTLINTIDNIELLPTSVELFNNYPNPFNPSTNIIFSLDKEEHIKIDLFDINGSLIEKILDGFLLKGKHKITFTPVGITSGVYIYRLSTPNQTFSKKMVYLK